MIDNNKRPRSRRLRRFVGAAIGLMVIGGLASAAVVGLGANSRARATTSSSPTTSLESTTPSFAYAGNYSATSTYNEGKMTIAPPQSAATLQYSASPESIYAAFEAASPAAQVAKILGYPTAQIYKATYTNVGTGVLDRTTNVITPAYDNSPVWILTYQNVQWPVGPGAKAVPSAAGSNGEYAATQLTPGLEDVYVIFSPSGQCLDTVLVPAS